MPASFGVQGPGDSTMASGSAAMTARARHLVVAVHVDLRAQFTEIVNQVEGKAVVIVDQPNHPENLYDFSAPARSNAVASRRGLRLPRSGTGR